MVNVNRRHFLTKCIYTFAGITFYVPQGNAIIPIIGIIARSLFSGGARSVARTTVRNSLRKGRKRAKKMSPKKYKNLSLSGELSFGLNFEVNTNVPIWKVGNSKNKVKFSINANLDRPSSVPILLQCKDLDSDEIEQQISYTLELPKGSTIDTVTCNIPFSNILDGRKEIHGGVQYHFANKVSINPEPFVLVIES